MQQTTENRNIVTVNGTTTEKGDRVGVNDVEYQLYRVADYCGPCEFILSDGSGARRALGIIDDERAIGAAMTGMELGDTVPQPVESMEVLS